MNHNKKYEGYHVHLTSDPPLLDLKLGQVWKYRDFIIIYSENQFAKLYKQTILGPIWLVINPLIQSLIYTFIFGMVAGIATDEIPQLLFFLASNGLWNFFSTVFSQCSITFTENSNLFGKVYFPRLTIPIAYVCIAGIEFLIQLLLFLAFSLFYLLKFGYAVKFAGLFLFPVFLLWLGSIGLGLGIIISAATAKYRDLKILVGTTVRLWMYATPIVYPMSQLKPGIVRALIRFNPLTPAVELWRKAIFGVGAVDPLSIGVSLLILVISIFVGLICFNKIEKNFMDTV